MRAELAERFTSPLYSFVAALIAFVALGRPRTSRQGRTTAMTAAAAAFGVLRMIGVGMINLAANAPIGATLAYAAAAGGDRGLPRACAWGPAASSLAAPRLGGRLMPITLWFYFGRRFIGLAVPLFAVIFFLIYAADLIELLRRGANSAQATAGRPRLSRAPAGPVRRRGDLPFCRAVRRDGSLPLAVAPDGARQRTRRGHFGLAIHCAGDS